MHQLLQREVQTNKYDLIFCHLIRMAPYVEKITGIKKVLDMCDALSFRYGLSYQLRKGPSKLIELIESKRLANYESKISEKFDLNLIASIKDKTYLEQKVGAKGLTVVENGVDLEACEYSQVQTDYKKIVFFGNLRTFHNIDAVQYFYKEIFPLVKQKIQEARFVIIGACVPRCILKMAKDRSVSILSEVENMHPHISDACVSVAPMRIAVGVQNKILQSMASKIPVVTTTLGLGGLQARAGQDILVADNPRDFADKVILLMRNRPTGDSIRQDAYRLIRERYLWPDVVDKLNKLLMHIV
ncbi:MAG: glycosyltransferase [Candidatus Omnitrophica bacterium]|nr:glycosyltransferase [Candidatus Omnitrophota bacterium]